MSGVSGRLSFTLATASEATGLSRSHLTREIKAGRLRAKKSSTDADGEPTGSTVILASELQSYLDGLVDA